MIDLRLAPLVKAFSVTWLLHNELKESRTMLDLGCGKGPGLTSMIMDGYKVGLDLYLPYLMDAKHHFDDVIRGDIRYLPFKLKSFDVVVLMEVIEHLNKRNGEKLLDELVRLARRKIIITTPNGFFAKLHLENGNPLQAHLSGWNIEDFLTRGYRVYGMNGWRRLRIEGGKPLLRPRIVGEIICSLTQMITFKRPQYAFQLLCIKNIKENNSAR